MPRAQVQAPAPASLPASPQTPAGASGSGGRSVRDRLRRDRFRWALIGLAALGGALVLARQAAYGVSVSVDSINYLAVAEHLLEGRGFRNSDWGVYAHHPPLYPLLLAAASLGVFEPIRVAGLLNAGLFAATVLVVGRYLRRRARSGWLALWGAGAVALSLPLGDLGSWALSETAFVLFATLALVRADDFLTEGRKAALVGAAVFGALAWQTRYIGVAVPAVVAAALWFGSDGGWRHRLRRSGFVAVAAALPMALWMARNHFAVGAFAGDREFRGTSLTTRFGEVGEALAGWFAFDVSVGAALVAALLALAVFADAAFKPGGGSPDGGRDPRPLPSGLRSPAIFVGFGAIFLFLTVAAAFFTVTGHGVESRFLAPLFAPCILLVVFAADRAFRGAAERPPGGAGDGAARRRRRSPGGESGNGTGPRFGRAALTAGLFFVLLTQVAPTLGAIREANSASPASWRGYTAPPWHDSPIFRHMDDTNIPDEVFSNFPILLQLRYGQRSFFRYLPLSEGWADWLEETPPGAYVVWFRHTPTNVDFGYALGDLRASAGLEAVAEFADGAVFRVNPDYLPPNPYHAAAESIASGAAGFPAASGDFDLFLDGTTLLYFREPCSPADTEAGFFLHAYRGDPAFRSATRERNAFENLDFAFTEYGERFDGKCVALVELPETGTSGIRTGQYESGRGELWSAGFTLDTERRKQRLADSETFRRFRGSDSSSWNAADFPEARAGERWRDYRARSLGEGALLLRLGSGWAAGAANEAPGAVSPVGVEPVARFASGAVFRVDAAGASNPYRPAIEFVTSGTAGEAVARGEFDLFLGGTTLLYFRESCDPEDAEPRFFLHAYPADPTLLTPSRRPYGFENFDFPFRSCGARLEGRCVAVVALPEIPLERIRTGQFPGGGPPSWEAEVSFAGEDAASPGADAETMRRLRALAAAGEGCSPATPPPSLVTRAGGEETGAPGAPGDPGPGERRWSDWIAGAEPGSLVVWFRDGSPASDRAPGSGIVEALAEAAGLEPDAWLSDGAVFRVNPAYAPDPRRAAWDYLTSAAAPGALADSEFDLHLDGKTLFYLRESCAPEDTTERFFLHVYARDTVDLPDSRVRYGFENLDFWFGDAGSLFDGKCLASVRLPDYRIFRVRTGQYRSNQGAIWSAEFLPGRESRAAPP